MTERVQAHIALGSNLGDRRQMIDAALLRLGRTPGIEVASVSSMHETEAVGPPGQGRFINAAAKLLTTLTPRELLNALLAVESSLGRVRDPNQRWGARLIDLDLLLYDDVVINEPGLTVPHPHLHERSFVLQPLSEIAADIQHPVLGRTIQSLAEHLRGDSVGVRPSSAE